jgi:hypothetical protein
MPKEIRFSDKTSGLVGYADGHAEVKVTLPWPLGSTTMRIEANELDAAKQFIDTAIVHRNSVGLGPRQAQRRPR